MDKIHIVGGNELKGEVSITGSKNACLPLLTLGILTDKELILNNVPDLEDVNTMTLLLKELGVSIKRDGSKAIIITENVLSHKADYELVRRMRASFLVLGPLLSREGFGQVSLPGGCSIGTRPVDLHLFAFKSLGADVDIRDGYVSVRAPRKGLIGKKIDFPKISVGATENAIMAAVFARGTTRLNNSARNQWLP